MTFKLFAWSFYRRQGNATPWPKRDDAHCSLHHLKASSMQFACRKAKRGKWVVNQSHAFTRSEYKRHVTSKSAEAKIRGYQDLHFPIADVRYMHPTYHPPYSHLNRPTARIYIRSLSPPTPLYTSTHPNAKPHVMSRALQSHHFYAQPPSPKNHPRISYPVIPKK